MRLLKEKIISYPFVRNWLNEIKSQGFDCLATRKLLLLAGVFILLILFIIGVATNRVSNNVAFLVELGKVSFSPRTFKSNLPPIFQVIAACESGGRQFDESGRVIRGRINRYDVGLYQINEVIHRNAIQNTGLDIYTEEGNTAFASYLYQQSGLEPRRFSRSCWRDAL